MANKVGLLRFVQEMYGMNEDQYDALIFSEKKNNLISQYQTSRAGCNCDVCIFLKPMHTLFSCTTPMVLRPIFPLSLLHHF